LTSTPAGILTIEDLDRHVARLATIVWNHGAIVEGPHLDEYDDGALVFDLSGDLPGPDRPAPTAVVLRETWMPVATNRYRRAEYAYELIEHPLGRRRAFHAHDRSHFVDTFDVATHEHCEESLGAPTCEHYFGLPVDAYAAVQRLMVAWGRPGPLGCDDLRCIA
jgi:hypothetical protein